MRKVPMKNYVIFFLLAVLTIVVVFTIRKTYLNKIDFEKSTNVTLNFLSSINEKELSTYLVENRDIILYLSSSSDDSINQFENEFRDYILNNHLSQDILYLNTKNVSKSFFKNFKKNYFADNLKSSNIEVINQPNLYLIENGKVTSVMYKNKQDINIKDVENFIEELEV